MLLRALFCSPRIRRECRCFAAGCCCCFLHKAQGGRNSRFSQCSPSPPADTHLQPEAGNLVECLSPCEEQSAHTHSLGVSLVLLAPAALGAAGCGERGGEKEGPQQKRQDAASAWDFLKLRGMDSEDRLLVKRSKKNFRKIFKRKFTNSKSNSQEEFDYK